VIALNSVHVKVISSPPDPGCAPVFFLVRRDGVGKRRQTREPSVLEKKREGLKNVKERPKVATWSLEAACVWQPA